MLLCRDISNNPLTALETQSLSTCQVSRLCCKFSFLMVGFANLLSFCLCSCTNTKVAVLPTSLAMNCPLLDTVSFNGSSIHTVQSQALVNLPKLQYMYVVKLFIVVVVKCCRLSWSCFD